MSRVRIKYFLEDPDGINPPELVPVFHRWIQRDALSGLWIDVADYLHVPEGPGIMLIGHEADLYLDFSRGKAGLAYVRKREFSSSLEDNVLLAIRSLDEAVSLFNKENALEQRYRVRTDELEITFLDRLRVPPELTDISTAVGATSRAVAEAAGREPGSIERIDADPRHPLSLRVRVPESASVSAVLELETSSTS